MECNPALKSSPAAVAALSLLLAGPVLGDCIVVTTPLVKVQVTSCRTFAEAAAEIRQAYARRWPAKDGWPSSERLELDHEEGRIVRGREIAFRNTAGTWRRESKSQERLFVLKADLACPAIRKGDVLEMSEETDCCDTGPSDVACILGASVLEAPVSEKKAPSR